MGESDEEEMDEDMIPYDDEEELDLELSDDDSAASEGGDKEEQKGARDTVTSNKEGSVSAASSEDIQYCQFPDCKFSCLCPKELAGHQKSKGHSTSVSAPKETIQTSEEDKKKERRANVKSMVRLKLKENPKKVSASPDIKSSPKVGKDCGFDQCDYSSQFTSNMKRHKKRHGHFTQTELEQDEAAAKVKAKVEAIEGNGDFQTAPTAVIQSSAAAPAGAKVLEKPVKEVVAAAAVDLEVARADDEVLDEILGIPEDPNVEAKKAANGPFMVPDMTSDMEVSVSDERPTSQGAAAENPDVGPDIEDAGVDDDDLMEVDNMVTMVTQSTGDAIIEKTSQTQNSTENSTEHNSLVLQGDKNVEDAKDHHQSSETTVSSSLSNPSAEAE